ncbi:shikimate dehydrogenase [Amycolatopsis nigrescens]|uniref:shikimate dehydrogenase n=1 Tax=Amycolatopsis nigrescens TaxID=381445 RepID=UPI0003A3CBAC|nr:shikimate dehydrogenase [Amycolatopsis nigrescens]
MPTDLPADLAAARRAAVLGKPVEHSLSPVLHGAAYRALGLDWSYERIEMDAAGLPGFAGALGPEWAGLSVTMPGKRAALEFATEVTGRAAAVGAANTLVPDGDGGWLADCTDVDGVTGALRAAGGYRDAAGRPGVVLGAGGTAAAAVVAFAELGVTGVHLVVRDPARAAETVTAAEQAGLAVEVHRWSETDFGALVAAASVLVSTVPSAALAPHLDVLAGARCLLDVIYHPWPTPLAEAVGVLGGRLATGLDMLLHQAFGQVELFTGQPAPRAEMRDALRAASGGILPLPLG